MSIKVKYLFQVCIVDKRQESKYCLVILIIMFKCIFFYYNHRLIIVSIDINDFLSERPGISEHPGGHSVLALTK